MTYKINRTDGLLIAEVVDGSINQVATDLTLIGKNVAGYGEFINENFVKILENFANTNQPNNPIIGQLWFDTTENKLKVYDGNLFKNTGSPIVSPSQPTNLTQGDLWINSLENQLYFYDGTDLQLAGPIYKQTQGISGFTVDSILDTTGIIRTVVSLWVAETLIGIFSKETTPFTPRQAISGFDRIIRPGFNQSTLSGLKFHVTSEKADTLTGPFNEALTYQSFIPTFKVEGGARTLSNIIIENELGLKITNEGSDFDIKVDENLIIENSTGKGVIIKSSNGSNAFQVNNQTKTVSIFSNESDSALEVGGNVSANSISVGAINAEANFNLPKYTTAQRNALTLTSEDYGDLIYNTTTDMVQVYTAPGVWSDVGIEGNSVDLSSVASDIVPSQDVTYNLGSPTKQWNSLYLSGSTMYLGGVPVSISNGQLLVDGAPVGGGSYGDLTGNPLSVTVSSNDVTALPATPGKLIFKTNNALTGSGKALQLVGGDALNGSGSYVEMWGGNGAEGGYVQLGGGVGYEGQGGGVYIAGAESTSIGSTGGEVTILAGRGGGGPAGRGGHVEITAGGGNYVTGQFSAGGNVIIKGGSGALAGGNVNIQAGTDVSNVKANINLTASTVAVTGDLTVNGSKVPKIVNTDGNLGTTIYVGSIDPSVAHTLVPGDVWIQTV